jgi:hypothetical protein
MTAKTINIIVEELKDIPEKKADSLLDYLHFIKHQTAPKKPNKTTLKAFKDSDEGKNLNHYDSVDDFLKKMRE